jgi:hypothetical protein
VQTGLGRTGRFFALEHWGLDPDMICVAKALSGGFVPIGGVLVSADVRDRVFDGMERGVRHGSTFGGNDMAAAAGLATLAVIEREGLVARAAELGELLLELTRPLVDRYEIVRDVRGLGLMWAIELGTPERLRRRAVWNLVERAQTGLAAQLIVVPLFQRHQIFCQVAGHRMNVVKALPALVVEEAEIRRFAAALEDVVARADRMGGGGRAAGLGPGARQRSRAAPVKALVTGAAGFIGSHVVAALAASGAQVRAFDRRTPADLPDGAEFVQGDLLDRDALRRALTAATPSSTSRRSTATRAPTRGDGARQRRGHARGARAGRRGRRVVHTASCATCGPVAGRAATESDRRRLGAARPVQAHEDRRRAAGARRPRPAAPTSSSSTRRRPSGPATASPTPTGKMVADVAGGRARAYLARSALNIVAVEDVARGHLLAFEHGRPGALPAGRREPDDARGVRRDLRRRRAPGADGSRCRGAPPTARRGSPRAVARSAPARARRGARRALADALRRRARARGARLQLGAGGLGAGTRGSRRARLINDAAHRRARLGARAARQPVVLRYRCSAIAKKTIKMPADQASDCQTQWRRGRLRAGRGRRDGDAERLVAREALEPAGHRGDGDDGVAREHEHEERQDAGDLGGFGVFGGQADRGVHPGEGVAEDDDQRHAGEDRAGAGVEAEADQEARGRS